MKSKRANNEYSPNGCAALIQRNILIFDKTLCDIERRAALALASAPRWSRLIETETSAEEMELLRLAAVVGASSRHTDTHKIQRKN